MHICTNACIGLYEHGTCGYDDSTARFQTAVSTLDVHELLQTDVCSKACLQACPATALEHIQEHLSCKTRNSCNVRGGVGPNLSLQNALVNLLLLAQLSRSAQRKNDIFCKDQGQGQFEIKQVHTKQHTLILACTRQSLTLHIFVKPRTLHSSVSAQCKD